MGVSGILDEQLKSIEDVRVNLESRALFIIAELQEQIVFFNTKRQLYDDGVDSKGSLLRPYTNFTVQIKQQSGQVYDRTTLKDTGSFYEGFYITAKNGLFQINSSDSKTPKLVKKYGKDIFGLTVNNEGIINKEIFDRLLEWIIKKM